MQTHLFPNLSIVEQRGLKSIDKREAPETVKAAVGLDEERPFLELDLSCCKGLL